MGGSGPPPDGARRLLCRHYWCVEMLATGRLLPLLTRFHLLLLDGADFGFLPVFPASEKSKFNPESDSVRRAGLLFQRRHQSLGC